MQRCIFCLLFLVYSVVQFGVTAEDILLYDSQTDPSYPKSEPRVQLYQPIAPESKESPPHPEYELMTQPCMGWQFQASLVAYNPVSDRELLLLTSPAEVGGTALVLTSLEDNASVMHRIPETVGAWALAFMKGDRIAVGTYYDGAIHIFSLAENVFTNTIDVPGEAYIWNFVEGKDGRLYGGTYPGGKLIALDQDTLTLEDCGVAWPDNPFLLRVSVLPDGRLLCHTGLQTRVNRIYDPETKTFSDTPPLLATIQDGKVWETYFVTEQQLFTSSLEAVDTLPFPVPETSSSDCVFLPMVTDAEHLFFRHGHAVYWYRKQDPAPRLLFDMDLRGGRLVGKLKKGGMIGLRGQQYVLLSDGDTQPKRIQLPIPSPPRVPHFLRADSKGQVWGAPASGQTLFFMDGETGVFVSLGSLTPAMGKVQDIAFIDGVTYGVTSPSGEIFRLDIEEPWHEWEGKNPRLLTSLKDPTARLIPTAGILAIPPSIVITGWSVDPEADYSGGAIAITRVSDGNTRRVGNPLGHRGIASMATDGTFLYVGTGSVRVKGIETPPAAQFALLDLETIQPYLNHEFPGHTNVDRLLYAQDLQQIAFAVDNRLHFFDQAKRRVWDLSEASLPDITSTALVARKDGCIYYGHGNALMRVHVQNGTSAQVIALPLEIGPLTSSDTGDIFAGCGIHVYRIRFPKNYP